MKIQSITTSNFLGARAVDVTLAKPVALFAGKNGAGKSSIQEAVRMALTGETVRVGLKKDYAALISEGQESGFAAVECSNAGYEAVLPSGKGNHSDNATLNYVLDAQRFARLPENDRRQFLFGLMGVKLDGPAVKLRLLDKGCDAGKAEQIAPILRAGFDAATKEAASKARDSKASWKTVTGGETWGKEKAPKWQPAPLPEGAEHAAADLEKAKAKLQSITADLDVALQTLGAAKASDNQRIDAERKRSNLEAIAANVESYTTKLNLDTAELVAWEQKVADCKAKAGVAQPDPKSPGEFLLRWLAGVTNDFLTLTCDFPDVEWPSELLNRASIHLSEYRKLHGDPVGHDAKPDQDAINKLPEYENALRLMQSSVANGKRNLEAAQIAVTQLKALDELKAEAVDTSATEAKVTELKERRQIANSECTTLSETVTKTERRAALIEQAAKLHADVMAWTAIADALAPDGIPAELLAEALEPMNHRLAVTAGDAQWDRIEIMPDMQIIAALHGRPYALLSESEKWRADAMIAEAVSHISSVKLLVLDRFDVLDGQGREDALYWLDGLAENGEIDTCLLFGTLKGLPAQLLPNIEAFWIENGTAGQIKEAA
jgi:hypothetical protein